MARTRARDYDEKRLAILKRSAELFAQHGYTGTSIAKIAQACGVSKALLYHYYPDKEAVLFDLLDLHLSDLVDVVEAAARAEEEPRDRLVAMVSALLEAYRDADAEHQVQLTSLKLLSPDRQDSLKALERRLVTVFSDVIAAATPEMCDVERLVRPLTMSLFGMLNWHYLWFREGRGLTRSDYAAVAGALILGGAGDAAAALAARRDAPRP